MLELFITMWNFSEYNLWIELGSAKIWIVAVSSIFKQPSLKDKSLKITIAIEVCTWNLLKLILMHYKCRVQKVIRLQNSRNIRTKFILNTFLDLVLSYFIEIDATETNIIYFLTRISMLYGEFKCLRL